MRREERVTVQGPVKEQQPDGMSHRGGLDMGGRGYTNTSSKGQQEGLTTKGFIAEHVNPLFPLLRNYMCQTVCSQFAQSISRFRKMAERETFSFEKWEEDEGALLTFKNPRKNTRIDPSFPAQILWTELL